MNQAFDLLWRRGVSALLLVVLVASLTYTPRVWGEETTADASSAETTSDVSDDSAADVEEESGETEEDSKSDAAASEPSDDATAQATDDTEGEEESEATDESEPSVDGEEAKESDDLPQEEAEETGTASSSEPESADGVTGNEDADTETGSHETASSSESSGSGSGEPSETLSDTLEVSSESAAGADDSTSVTSTTSPDATTASSSPAAPTIELTSSSTETAATTTTTGTTTTPTASSSTTTIESGTAVALANIINIVNSNFINSDGVVFFSNFLEAVTEALDLRNLYNSLANFGCSLTSCTDDDTTVNVSNDAFIENYLLLQALTGGNLISGADTGVINTGDAYAGLNLINVANMNFIDSNYLLVTLNAFNDVNGDIIFPSTDLLLSSLAYSPDGANINLSNTANVTNDLTIDADSGGNELQTSNGGSITTGATGATSNVFNQINSSLIGGQNITIMFRIHGDWVGEVFGAPDDLLWTQSPDGSILLFDSNSGNGGSYSAGSLNVDATNNASINNDISIAALTGENQITGTETGLISTGNAYAGANIVNLANGNVIGRNWVLAIVNIFGDFKGNIAFGRPDLWIGEMVDAPSKITNGSLLKYKFTVINNGDSPATEVFIEDAYEADHLTIKSASLPYTTTADGTLRFALGKIPKGGAVEITYEAEVMNTSSEQELTNVVTVKGRETDNNFTDNTDTATVKTYSSGGGKKTREITRNIKETPLLSGIMEEGDALLVKRMFKTFPLTPEYPSMRQVVVLNNPTTHSIPGVVFEDILKDPAGNVIKSEVWELGEVLPGEEIELGYTLAFESGAPTGTYTLHSKITTQNGGEDIHQNGTVIFTALVLPEALPSWLQDMEFTAPQLTSILPQFASSIGGMTLESWIRSVLRGEGGMVLPTLSTHSMSTATRQHDTEDRLGMWLDQLYEYLSYLVTKVAPNIALAWVPEENYKF